MPKKSKIIETKTINGISVNYEVEEGRTFAVAYCPICGNKEEAMSLGLDSGKMVAGRVKSHIEREHETKKT